MKKTYIKPLLRKHKVRVMPILAGSFFEDDKTGGLEYGGANDYEISDDSGDGGWGDY